MGAYTRDGDKDGEGARVHVKEGLVKDARGLGGEEMNRMGRVTVFMHLKAVKGGIPFLYSTSVQ